jgi:hypothetical protein
MVAEVNHFVSSCLFELVSRVSREFKICVFSPPGKSINVVIWVELQFCVLVFFSADQRLIIVFSIMYLWFFTLLVKHVFQIVVSLDTVVSSNTNTAVSEEVISFHDTDILTPSQKLLASKLSCNVVPGKSLLLTGM